MDGIYLQQVKPGVFANQEHMDSDVWDKELCLEKGNCYLLEAVSGRGKTSFCSYLYGNRSDYSGKICFDRTDIREYHTKEWAGIRKRTISTLFQELRLFPELTAMENVLIKNRLTQYKTAPWIERAFHELGIADKKDQAVARLSFGQQQRVAFIRSLCQPFDFIILDEPISHLDQENGRIMGQILMQELKLQGGGLIVTSIGKHPELPYDKTLRL